MMVIFYGYVLFGLIIGGLEIIVLILIWLIVLVRCDIVMVFDSVIFCMMFDLLRLVLVVSVLVFWMKNILLVGGYLI